MTDHLLRIVVASPANVLLPTGAGEVSVPDRLHQSGQGLLRLRLLDVEPAHANRAVLERVANVPVNAKDVRRVPCESWDLLGRDVVDCAKAWVGGGGMGGPEGELVDDHIRLGQDGLEACVAVADVATHRLGAVIVACKGTILGGCGRQGNYLGPCVVDEPALVDGVVDDVLATPPGRFGSYTTP